MTGSVALQYHLNEKTDLVPMFWFRNLKKVSETVPQCMISYLFNVEKKVRLNAGLGYRIDDALQIMAGMDYGNIKAQVAKSTRHIPNSTQMECEPDQADKKRNYGDHRQNCTGRASAARGGYGGYHHRGRNPNWCPHNSLVKTSTHMLKIYFPSSQDSEES